jgi:hypothetical protein
MLPSFRIIVEKVYKSQWFNEVIDKMQPEQLQQDLKQEVIMVLLELGEQRITQMEADGMLKFYTIRTILNMIKSDRSKFFTMFRNYEEIPDIKEQANEDYLEMPDIDLNTIFDNTREQLYEKDMLFHYCYSFDRNALAMSRGTGIPYKTIIRTLTNAKNKVKCYLQSQQQ